MKSAVYTLMHNEEWYLPMWIKYYSQYFDPEDMYILCHNCSGPVEETIDQAEQDGINIKRLSTDVIFDHDWLLDTIKSKQVELLERYDYVLFTDCDEFVVPVGKTLREYIDTADQDAYRCHGYDVAGDRMATSHGFCKTLLSRVPLNWSHGYHTTTPEYPMDPNLELYHLHYLDYDKAFARSKRLAEETWDQFAVNSGLGVQNRVTDEEQFDKDFHHHYDRAEPYNDRLVNLLDKIK